MTALNKQALREAAVKALPAMQRLLMMYSDELFDEDLLNIEGDVEALDAFNLLVGPETILALLDELEAEKNMREAAEKRIAELEARTVTLPEPFKLAKSSSGLTYYYADEVDAAIQAAGIGVKGE